MFLMFPVWAYISTVSVTFFLPKQIQNLFHK